MPSFFLQLLLFGILAALANVLGGLILLPAKPRINYKKTLRYLLALGAGFMLAVTFFEILPKTLELWQTKGGHSEDGLIMPMLLLLGGYLLTQFFEHTVAPHFHLGDDLGPEEMIRTSSAYTAIAGLVIHTFFDGVSIAAASQIDSKIGTLVFIAVFLHKFPEGFTVGSMVMAAGKGFREVMIATGILGLTTLAGLISFYIIGQSLGFTIAYALPIAGGVTLYVAASDLIPEVNHHGGKSPLVSLSVFGGVALFFATHYLLHTLMGA